MRIKFKPLIGYPFEGFKFLAYVPMPHKNQREKIIKLSRKLFSRTLDSL